ncbi:hypothetical protein BB560_004699 [Smittium megazygosporum]|uniref:Uncharacterized protein n=1 Tax=Smittium megazygosporum TaxID=133381 RepID=A0A2T9Z8H8_9FUNG|nr:hypothetical protein BB560_004699 [Smittium megazygosporum]
MESISAASHIQSFSRLQENPFSSADYTPFSFPLDSLQPNQLPTELDNWRASQLVWESILSRIQNVVNVFIDSLENTLDFAQSTSANSNLHTLSPSPPELYSSLFNTFQTQALNHDQQILEASFSTTFRPQNHHPDSDSAIKYTNLLLDSLSFKLDTCYSRFRDIRDSIVKDRKLFPTAPKNSNLDDFSKTKHDTKIHRADSSPLPSAKYPPLPPTSVHAKSKPSYTSQNPISLSSAHNISSKSHQSTTRRRSNTEKVPNNRPFSTALNSSTSPIITSLGSQPSFVKSIDKLENTSLIYLNQISLLERKLQIKQSESLIYQKLCSQMKSLLTKMQSSLDNSHLHLNHSKIEIHRLSSILSSTPLHSSGFPNKNTTPILDDSFIKALYNLVLSSKNSASKNSIFFKKFSSLVAFLNSKNHRSENLPFSTFSNKSEDSLSPENQPPNTHLFSSSADLPLQHSKLVRNLTDDSITNDTADTNNDSTINNNNFQSSVPIHKIIPFINDLNTSYSNICAAYNYLCLSLIEFLDQSQVSLNSQKFIVTESTDFLELLELYSSKINDFTSQILLDSSSISFNWSPSIVANNLSNNNEGSIFDLSTTKSFSDPFDIPSSSFNHHPNVNEIIQPSHPFILDSNILTELAELTKESSMLNDMLNESSLSHFFDSQNAFSGDLDLSPQDFANTVSSEVLTANQKRLLKSEYIKRKTKLKTIFNNRLAEESEKVAQLQKSILEIREKAELKISDYIKIRDYQFEKIVCLTMKNAIISKVKKNLLEIIGGPKILLSIVDADYYIPQTPSNKKSPKYYWNRAKFVRYALRLVSMLSILKSKSDKIQELKQSLKLNGGSVNITENN